MTMLTKQAKVNTDKLYTDYNTFGNREKSEINNIVEISDLIDKQKTERAKAVLKEAASKLDW